MRTPEQPWSVLIAERELGARRQLRELVDSEPEFEVTAEVEDGPRAVAHIVDLRPDLVFLDPQMTGKEGLAILRALDPSSLPWIVFVTDWNDRLLDTLDEGQVACLAKPFDPARVRDHLARARRVLGRGRAPRDAHGLWRLLAVVADPAHAPLARLHIRQKRGTLTLELDEVDWIAAAGNYVELHANGRRYLHRMTLSALHEQLDRRHFARIHRSRIVRLDRIVQVQWITNGDAHLHLRGGQRLRLSRRFRSEFDRRRRSEEGNDGPDQWRNPVFT